MRRLGYLIRMAARDLAHEWSVSAAVTLAITAVAAPILVLLGLYGGVVGEIFAGLRADPGAREVRLAATGATRFDATWFDEVRGWPEVAFAQPSTRYASAQVQAVAPESGREGRASLIPTGAGDPVFGDTWGALEANEAGISAALARRLGVAAGETVEIEVTRSTAAGGETAFAALTLRAVARAAHFGREALFVAPALLEDVENYRNGHAAPLLGVTGDPAPPRAHHPNFRLYARDVRDVGPLAARLSAEPYNLTLNTDAGRIDFAIQLDEGLGAVVFAVGALGAVGLAGGLAAVQWSMAARRRRTIAVLNLIGFPRPALIALPVMQALMLGLVGAALTLGTAAGIGALIGALTPPGLGLAEAGVGLTLGPALGVTGAILILSALPAVWIGIVYSNLEASDEIRET